MLELLGATIQSLVAWDLFTPVPLVNMLMRQAVGNSHSCCAP
jgi:hypothetical protein